MFNRQILSLVLILLCGIAHSASFPTLHDLDTVVANQSFYTKRHEQEITRTKLNILRAKDRETRYKETEILHTQYSSFRIDSALFYAEESLKMAKSLGRKDYEITAKFHIIGTLTQIGMYKEAEDMLDGVDRSSLNNYGDDLIRQYYFACNTLYDALSKYTTSFRQGEEYKAKAYLYKDSILQCNPSEALILADFLTEQGKGEEGLNVLLETFKKTDSNDRYMAYVAYAISDLYRRLGDSEAEKQYLIISAMSDIKSAVKEYISLRRLATILYEEGDIERAHTYMRRSLDDALFSNARFRTIETSQILPVIDKAYQMQEQKKRRQLLLALICISALSAIAIALVAYIRRQMSKLNKAKEELSKAYDGLNRLNSQLKHSNQQLNDANANLSDMNHSLSEANTIKEAYIVRFMTECSAYIDKLDKYRTRLNKKAISGDMKGLIKDLKSSTLMASEIEEFHASFDDTFLQLFPSFIDKFNALLPESERVEAKQPGRLTTKLRIFALYRLGISDNERIASFLRCSMATIYAYRSRVSSKSLDPEHFEENIMKL